ncbi:MAG: transcription elongation factor GreA [Candidatus Levybacteria bacterium]|nr:transcription elongation factor GreA [Candidatus Levybacteria bacterium]
MDAKKIYLTKDGFSDLKREYEELTKIKRPEVVSRVSAARDQGDLSENAEYTAAREELSFIDGRIDELEELLKEVVLIQGNSHSHRMVSLGSTVTVKVDGRKEEYTVVGEFEADPTAKKISHASPLGKALIGKKVGETVAVEAPAGKIVYTVLAVQ